MNSSQAVQTFISQNQRNIAMEYDDTSAHSRLMQQAYMVGVLESTLVNVLEFIEIRCGEQAMIDAMERACIIK